MADDSMGFSPIMGNVSNSMMFADPGMRAALMRQQYAQSLMAQGQEITPLRSPWQAFARAAQGALGGYFMGSSLDDMTQRQTQLQNDANQFMFGSGGGFGMPLQQPSQQLVPPQGATPPQSKEQLSSSSANNALVPYPPQVGGDAPQVDLTTVTSPSGVKVTVAKDAAPAFTGLLSDLEANGYKLDPSQTGGYNSRKIAGTNTWSQHAFGRAIDVNWQQNPNGANTQSTLDPDLARKLAAKNGLIWGGDWTGSQRDPMHFELAQQNTAGGPDTLTSDQQAFITNMTPYAKQAAAATGTTTQNVLAQWANESGWGSSDAAKNGNFGGLKNPSGGYATFNTPQDFTDAYVKTLQQPQYANARNTGTDSGAFVKGLKQGGYFEGDPATYTRNVGLIASRIGPLGAGTQVAGPGAPTGPGGQPQPTSLDVGQHDGGMPAGFAMAQQLRARAQAAAMSTNPYIRAQAPLLMQQATSFMQMGAWGQPIPMPNGQYLIRNQLSGETKMIGAETTLTKDSAGNLVNNRGQVIAPSGGYTYGYTNNYGQPIYFGPDGKPMTLGEMPRPEAYFSSVVSQVNDLINRGQPVPPQLQADYPQAFQRLYPTENKLDETTGQMRTYQPHPPPSGTRSPEDIQGYKPGQPPPPGGQTPSGGTPGLAPGAVQTTPLPGMTQPQVELIKSGVQHQQENDLKLADEATDAANKSQSLLATTQTIRDLLPKFQTGRLADVRLEGEQMLRALGASDATVNESLVSGELLQKNLLQLVAQRVREMGAREPGSVISMFAHNFPSLLSRPETIDAMTRIMDMDARFQQAKAGAMTDWVNGQRQRLAQPGADISNYQGVGSSAFASDFNAKHDPRVYLGAALASSGMPRSTWASGLSGNQPSAALKLAWGMYPDAVILDKDNNKRTNPALQPAPGGGG